MRRCLWFLAVIILVFSLFSACVQKQNVGKTISYNHPAVCSFSKLPKVCSFDDGNFIFEYKISQGKTADEYIIDGTFICMKWPNLDVYNSMFWLILANNGVSIDEIAFRPKGGDLKFGVPFRRSFKSSTFDAVYITYRARVTD